MTTDIVRRLDEIVTCFGFLTDADVALFTSLEVAEKFPWLAKAECLIRYGMGRRVVPVGGVLEAIIEIEKRDVVRDVSFTPDEIAHIKKILDYRRRAHAERMEQAGASDNGFVWDGAGFVSDADPGL